MTDARVRSLLNKWLKPDRNWKHIILDLYDCSEQSDSPFSKNAVSGISYLNAVIFNQMCYRCGDKKGFAWMDAYAKAYLNADPLPEFQTGCWTEDCDGKS